MAGTRHFWWWLGVRPIDRANVDSLLEAKQSVAMVPGGISETMVMQPGALLHGSQILVCQQTELLSIVPH